MNQQSRGEGPPRAGSSRNKVPEEARGLACSGKRRESAIAEALVLRRNRGRQRARMAGLLRLQAEELTLSWAIGSYCRF